MDELRYRAAGRVNPLPLVLLILVAWLAFACSSGGGGGGEPPPQEPTGPTATELFNAAKAQLETLLAADSPTTGQFFDVFQQFQAAYAADPTLTEPAFYAGFGQLLLFLDSQTTTDVLGRMGLGRFRDEADLCHSYEVQNLPCPPELEPFQSDGPVIIGGDRNLQSYVDLTFVETETYTLANLPDSLRQAQTILGSTSSSWSSTLANLREGGSWDLDYSDLLVVKAFYETLELAPAAFNLWNLRASDVDNLLSTSAFERDPTTGDFLQPASVRNPAIQEFYLKGADGIADNGDEPLTSDGVGVTYLKTLLANLFDTLAAGLSSLLLEGDSQADDVIVIGTDQPGYDLQPEVERFVLDLLRVDAQASQAAFAASGAAPLTLYEPVARITNFETCPPLAGQPMDTSPNNRTSLFSLGPVPVANVIDVTGSIESPTGASHTTSDPTYTAYVFKLTLTEPKDLSIFTRDSGTSRLDTEITVAYPVLDTLVQQYTLVQWDQDFDSGARDHVGISIDADYFGNGVLPLPSSQSPLVLYFLVRAELEDGPSAPNSGFRLYVWTPTGHSSDIPIFLKGGGGRNFAMQVYARTDTVDAQAIVDVASEFFDRSDRASLVLDDPATPLVDEDFLKADASTSIEAQVRRVFPNATVTVTDDPDAAGSDATNVLEDDIEIRTGLDTPILAGSYAIPSAVQSFCSYPWEFSTVFELEAGFAP